MLKRLAFASVAAAVTTLAAGASHAQSEFMQRATAANITGMLQSQGLPAQTRFTSKGNPYIRSRVDGFNFSVYLVSCSKTQPKSCLGIQFYSGYRKRNPLTYAQMNEWNRRNRYARGYLVRDRESGQLTRARVEMDLSFSGGMTRRIFIAHYRLFRRLKASFRKHIRFNVGAASGPVKPKVDGGGQGRKKGGDGDHTRGIEGLQD